MFATNNESIDEWARNVGHYPRFIDQQWLLHDKDIWVKNPHYTGPAQHHPEDFDEGFGDDFMEGYEECDDDMSSESDREAFASAGMGTDEDYGMFSDPFDF